MTKLLVGGPVRSRHWILPKWRETVLVACERAGVEPEFLFVTSRAGNTATVEMLEGWPDTRLVFITEPDRSDLRTWTRVRLNHMATLRQRLVMEVRRIRPTAFLSLDTDILLHPDAVSAMRSILDEHPDAWAVGGKAYMSPAGIADPSFGMMSPAVNPNLPRYGPRASQKFIRWPSDEVTRVDVVMAVILMTPRAYNVDYRLHPSGEDIGWSLAVGDAGGELWWDGAHTSTHVFTFPHLYLKDPRP